MHTACAASPRSSRLRRFGRDVDDAFPVSALSPRHRPPEARTGRQRVGSARTRPLASRLGTGRPARTWPGFVRLCPAKWEVETSTTHEAPFSPRNNNPATSFFPGSSAHFSGSRLCGAFCGDLQDPRPPGDQRRRRGQCARGMAEAHTEELGLAGPEGGEETAPGTSSCPRETAPDPAARRIQPHDAETNGLALGVLGILRKCFPWTGVRVTLPADPTRLEALGTFGPRGDDAPCLPSRG